MSPWDKWLFALLKQGGFAASKKYQLLRTRHYQIDHRIIEFMEKRNES